MEERQNLLNNVDNIISVSIYEIIMKIFIETENNYLKIEIIPKDGLIFDRYILYNKEEDIINVYENNELKEINCKYGWMINRIKIFKLLNDTVDYGGKKIFMMFKNHINSDSQLIHEFNINKIVHKETATLFDECLTVITPFHNYKCDDESKAHCNKVYGLITNFIENLIILKIIDEYYYFCDSTEINGYMHVVEARLYEEKLIGYYLETPDMSANGYEMGGGIVLFIRASENFGLESVVSRLSNCCGHPDIYVDDNGWCCSHGESDFPSINYTNIESYLDVLKKLISPLHKYSIKN